ncbi:hypothetical protein [Glycomyces sp. YM15]|uniref:hypothetical protein n=1 Tax=Glycomyces sp. YM15 TaxID=2800446 RepID=UPI0019655C94|nr:hypothetical protein [Glycomyces sp. YM15]
MTDDLFDDDGTFGDGFFSSLAASPDDPASAYAFDDASDDGAGEDDFHFLYEVEGDGSFETDAEDFDDGTFDHDYDYDPGFDADAEIDLEPDFDPDHDFDHEGDHEFGPDLGRGFGPGV